MGDETSVYERIMKNNNSSYIPILTVCYGGGKFLCLSSFDKNFDTFVKKVREVYLKEKVKIKNGVKQYSYRKKE